MNQETAMDYAQQLQTLLLSAGASEVGFSLLSGHKEGTLIAEYPGSAQLNYGVTITVKLSDAVVDGITRQPTHAYFHHYRTVNALIDQLIVKAGFWIEEQGFLYLPVAASQSVDGLQGLFQHKTAARLSGLGGIGRSGLFLSHRYGCRVRLGTLITNMPLPPGTPFEGDICGACTLCASLCPAMAISAEPFSLSVPNDMLDRRACSDYMKKHFQHIGRGAVCGVCIKHCPAGKRPG